MIDAARQALADGAIDAYQVRLQAPGYQVRVRSGSETREAVGDTEEAAFAAARGLIGEPAKAPVREPTREPAAEEPVKEPGRPSRPRPRARASKGG